MLGRREEEAEREELERQMREQEEMELEIERGGEEVARQARLRELQQQQQEQQGVGVGAGGEETGQRDLDDEIPDATAQHELDGDGDGDGEEDLDDDVPDADNPFLESDDNVEGETGITDEVEHTNLEEGDNNLSPQPAAATSTIAAPPGNRGAQILNPQQLRPQAPAYHHHDQEQVEQEALLTAMLAEDEQALADRDLDADIPTLDDEDELDTRNLDDDVPEADDDEIGEGEWQHTDTELEEDESGMMLMEDEGDVSMDMSVVEGRRSVSGLLAAAAAAAAGGGGGSRRSMLSTPAAEGGSSMLHLHTPTSGDGGGALGVGRSWLSRQSLSTRERTGNLFAGIMGRGSTAGSGGGSPQAPMAQTHGQMGGGHAQELEQGQQQQQQQQQQLRRSGRRGLGRENRSTRESLD